MRFSLGRTVETWTGTGRGDCDRAEAYLWPPDVREVETFKMYPRLCRRRDAHPAVCDTEESGLIMVITAVRTLEAIRKLHMEDRAERKAEGEGGFFAFLMC